MRIITVVGRDSNVLVFEKTLKSHLGFPWKIKGIIPLESDEEAKNFLAFIDPGTDYKLVENEVEEDYDAYDSLSMYLTEEGLYDVTIHESPDDAWSWVNETYREEMYARFKAPITAKEITLRDIFYGLIATSEIGVVRGLLDSNPVVVFVHGTEGMSEAKDTLVTPYAILVDEELGKRLEIPFTSAFDDE